MRTKSETKAETYAEFVLLLRDHFADSYIGANSKGLTDRSVCNRKAIECARNLRALARAYKRHNLRERNDSEYVNKERENTDGEFGSACSFTQTKLDARRAALAIEYSLTLNAQGDPRGYSLRVMNLGKWNTWGGEGDGYGVPEA